jgi:hypothetical protein
MNRAALVAGSIACFASAILLWPAGVRSQLDVQTRERPLTPAPRAEPSLLAVAPEGDAFAPRAVVDDEPPPVRPPARALPPLPAVRPGAALQRSTAVTHVTAIATGEYPTAVVEAGGAPRIVSVGDPLDGSTIAAIDDDAIRLSDGRRLSLEAPEGTH